MKYSAGSLRLFFCVALFGCFLTAAPTYAGVCGDDDGPYVFVRLSERSLPPEVTAGLSAAMLEQANLWGDTILEGDFISVGSTRLDKVQAVYESASGVNVGYRITYSEKAWSIESCGYSITGRTEGCKAGRISEASYVDLDLKSWCTDSWFMADFRS